MRTSRIRVFFASDRQILVDLLSSSLSADGTLDVTLHVGRAEEAQRLIQTLNPDVIVLDDNRLDVAELLIAIGVNTPLVVLFTNPITSIRVALMVKLGARGCVAATQPITILIEAIRTVARDGLFMSDEFQRHLTCNALKRRFDVAQDGPLTGFSGRQLEVLSVLAEGCSVKQAAKRLSVTPKAVENQKYRIMRRLHIHDRVELSRFAIREGLIEP